MSEGNHAGVHTDAFKTKYAFYGQIFWSSLDKVGQVCARTCTTYKSAGRLYTEQHLNFWLLVNK